MVITLLAIAGALVTTMGTVGFLEFIYEEALQTQAFTTRASINLKNWARARESLTILRSMADQMSLFVNTIGWLNPLSKNAFDNIVRSTYDQIDVYEGIISKGEGAAPAWRNTFADYKGDVAPEDKLRPEIEPKEVSKGVITEVIDGDSVIYTTGDMILTKTYDVLRGEAPPLEASFMVRLVGLDAPEAWTDEGQAAKSYVISRLIGRGVTVKIDPTQRYGKHGRVLGVIFLDDENINKTLITEGYAKPAFALKNKYFTAEEMRQAAGISLEQLEIELMKIKPPEFLSTKKTTGLKSKEVTVRESPDYRAKRTKKLVQYRYKGAEMAAKKDHDVITDEETLYEDAEETKVTSTREQPRSDETSRVKSYGAPLALVALAPPLAPPTPPPEEIINAELIEVFTDGEKVY